MQGGWAAAGWTVAQKAAVKERVVALVLPGLLPFGADSLNWQLGAQATWRFPSTHGTVTAAGPGQPYTQLKTPLGLP